MFINTLIDKIRNKLILNAIRRNKDITKQAK